MSISELSTNKNVTLKLFTLNTNNITSSTADINVASAGSLSVQTKLSTDIFLSNLNLQNLGTIRRVNVGSTYDISPAEFIGGKIYILFGTGRATLNIPTAAEIDNYLSSINISPSLGITFKFQIFNAGSLGPHLNLFSNVRIYDIPSGGSLSDTVKNFELLITKETDYYNIYV